MNSDALKNPFDFGKPFNAQAQPVLRPITKDEKEHAETLVQRLIEHTRETLELGESCEG